MKEPHLSGIAKALAAQGRNGDDTLIHVSRKELEAIQRMGDGLGIHLTKNPATGMPEAFNWLGALGGVAGGIIGTIIAPGAGTAAGAAIGSAAGTAAGGGSTKQALIAGVLGGITGYAGAGLGNAIADVGAQAAAEGVSQTGGQLAGQAGGQTLAEGSSQGVGSVVGDTFVQNGTQALTQTPLQQVSQTGAQSLAEGSSQGVGSVVGDKFVPNPANMSYGDKLSAGWDKLTSNPSELGKFASSNLKGIGTTGMGLLGIGALNPTESNIVSPDQTEGTKYKGEMYIDPRTGQRRSRAVPMMARGGEVYGDYDGVDEAADGGYTPGGGLNMAEGGEADSKSGVASLYDATPDDLVVNDVNWTQAAALGPKRRNDGLAAGGGIGDLGSYSDGGRLLRGPGDGVSDSIPASIEHKRPARLADGEFVIPARAVSELGNGSTEAGSKRLYEMLDRIAAKRKSGKGLAYESNPKKLMPA